MSIITENTVTVMKNDTELGRHHPVTDGGVAEAGKSDGRSGGAEAGGVLFAPEDIGAAGRFLPAMISLALILAVASAAAAVVSAEGVRLPVAMFCAVPVAVSVASVIIMIPAAFARRGRRVYNASRIYLTFAKVFSLFYALTDTLIAALVLAVSIVLSMAVKLLAEWSAKAVEAVKNNELVVKFIEADGTGAVKRLFERLSRFLVSLIPEEGMKAIGIARWIAEHRGALTAALIAAAALIFLTVGVSTFFRHLYYAGLRGRLRRLCAGYFASVKEDKKRKRKKKEPKPRKEGETEREGKREKRRQGRRRAVTVIALISFALRAALLFFIDGWLAAMTAFLCAAALLFSALTAKAEREKEKKKKEEEEESKDPQPVCS